MQRNLQLPAYDRLSVVTAVIVLGYALARVVELPTRIIETSLFGSPIGVTLNGQSLLLLLVAALISTGSDAVIRSHPRLQDGTAHAGSTAVHWILPGLAALALGLLLNRAPVGPVWWLGLALSAAFLVLVLLAEYTVVDPEDRTFQTARLGLTVLAYLALLAILGWLRLSGARAAISAPASALVCAAVSFRLLRLQNVSLLYSFSSAVLVALVVGQSVWALSYWFIHPLGAGLLLLDVFYVVHGLLQQNANPPVPRRVVVEYIVVGSLGIALALQFVNRAV